VTLTRREFLRDVAAALAAGGAAAMAPGILRAAGTSAPDGDECPIEHIVVLTMENRSFDHYFGSLTLDEGRTEVDGIVRDAGGALPSNPWLGGDRLAMFPIEDTYCQRLDPPHEWESSRIQYADGTNEGYLRAMQLHHNDPSEPDARQPGMENVMGYYTRPQLPFLYSAADEFTICDRHFSPVGAPTLPNRHYLHAATSGGLMDNRLDDKGTEGMGNPLNGFGFPTIYDRIDEAAANGATVGGRPLDWGVYYLEAPFTMLYREPRTRHPERFKPFAAFFADLALGTLPSYVTLDPGYFTASDHSPQHVQLGQIYMAAVYAALASSGLWNKTALFITYDEDGGFYDHVPHTFFPDERANADLELDFSKSGGRLPSVVVSPWVGRGAVHRPTPVGDATPAVDHTSILAFAEWRFGLTPLTMRDAAALAENRFFLEAFDFGAGPRAAPMLDVPAFEPGMLTDCAGTYVGPPPPDVPLPPITAGVEASDLLLHAARAGLIPMASRPEVEATLRLGARIAKSGL
jgi:phospholipase C